MGVPPWELDSRTSALLVIDMHNDFVLPDTPMEVPMAKDRVPNQRHIISVCRSFEIPVIFTQHILFDSFEISPLECAYNPNLRQVGMRAGSHGAEVIAELRPEDNDVVLPKHRYDAFHNTQLKSVLNTVRGAGIVDTVIIVGTLTEVCCESTARSAFMHDYKVAFIDDATAALSQAAQSATVDVIGRFFGRVFNTTDVVTALQN